MGGKSSKKKKNKTEELEQPPPSARQVNEQICYEPTPQKKPAQTTGTSSYTIYNLFVIKGIISTIRKIERIQEGEIHQ